MLSGGEACQRKKQTSMPIPGLNTKHYQTTPDYQTYKKRNIKTSPFSYKLNIRYSQITAVPCYLLFLSPTQVNHENCRHIHIVNQVLPALLVSTWQIGKAFPFLVQSNKMKTWQSKTQKHLISRKHHGRFPTNIKSFTDFSHYLKTFSSLSLLSLF